MKITFEHDGYRMVVDQKEINVTLKTDTVEIPCDCPVGCGYIHRKLRSGARLEVSADLPIRPDWKPVN